MILIYGKERNLTINSQEAIDCESTRFMNKGKSWQNIREKNWDKKRQPQNIKALGSPLRAGRLCHPLVSHFSTIVILN